MVFIGGMRKKKKSLTFGQQGGILSKRDERVSVTYICSSFLHESVYVGSGLAARMEGKTNVPPSHLHRELIDDQLQRLGGKDTDGFLLYSGLLFGLKFGLVGRLRGVFE